MHSSEHSSGNMQVSKFVQLESWRALLLFPTRRGDHMPQSTHDRAQNCTTLPPRHEAAAQLTPKEIT